ncbi:addiction module antidote protein, HigA family [Mycobacteroides abscessus subsp. abscessus]|uniref:HigA family addiction module antitoxin n=1 Tax=Mycobacteroides abscessus TaxID=36809 RepID=UPI00092AD3D4|nr:HigA family addiction module antitoxin [Mycobacteroides abscessus]SIH24511.1 addiction module antidote protein, HigA family [Mycobacteroides abscessus subsp. abscessus]
MSSQPTHPGTVLVTEFMPRWGLSQNSLARALGVSPRRINLLVQGRRAVTAETALLLAQFFGTTAQMWVDLQSRFDLAVALQEPAMQARLDAIVPLELRGPPT